MITENLIACVMLLNSSTIEIHKSETSNKQSCTTNQPISEGLKIPLNTRYIFLKEKAQSETLLPTVNKDPT